MTESDQHGFAIGRIGRDESRAMPVFLKFFACSAICTAGWMLLLGSVAPSSGGGEPIGGWRVLARLGAMYLGMVATVLPSAWVYLRLPNETEGLTHRLGKAFALFLPINITLSTLVVIFELYRSGVAPGSTLAMDIIGLWVIATIFIPGPYIGALIAARWSDG